MASCYQSSAATFTTSSPSWIPQEIRLSDGTLATLRALAPSDVPSACSLLNHAIVVDRAWPFDAPLSRDSFSSYFCSHAAFGIAPLADPSTLLGIFYVKPNFPDRCDHICNGGFVTSPEWRRRGVGRAMADAFFRIARDLGYRGVVFNLVFANNPASVALWRSVGMQQIGIIPRVARMHRDGSASAFRGNVVVNAAGERETAYEYVDAYVMYRSLDEEA